VARLVCVRVQDTLELYESLALKARDGRLSGRRRIFLEVWVGDSFHKLTGLWNKLERLIDRRRDRYRERITDPRTGKILRDVDEPLSAHRDRGSAKRRKRTSPPVA
jgi:hypothetical protein